jgi:hypothetical protein
MKRLPPAKRNNLIIVIAITIALLCGVYFFLIQSQKEQNIKLAHDTIDRQDELDKIKKSIKQADITDANLTEITLQLNRAEEDVVTGDPYAWIYDTIRRFRTNYHVDIPNIGQPITSEVDLLGGFPYKQVKVSLSGTAYFHDLGKFIADFENAYPHVRLVNLSLEPAAGGGPNSNGEKLTFRVDMVALFKSNT